MKQIFLAFICSTPLYAANGFTEESSPFCDQAFNEMLGHEQRNGTGIKVSPSGVLTQFVCPGGNFIYLLESERPQFSWLGHQDRSVYLHLPAELVARASALVGVPVQVDGRYIGMGDQFAVATQKISAKKISVEATELMP